MNIEINPMNRDNYLNLLLLADEEINMLNNYMYQGDMFVFSKNSLIGVCIVLQINSTTCELKNISIDPSQQHLGYGKACITYIIDYYKNHYTTILVGTGANTPTVRFYECCGFYKTYITKDFFIKNYHHPIYDAGIQLKDMQYLERIL